MVGQTEEEREKNDKDSTEVWSPAHRGGRLQLRVSGLLREISLGCTLQFQSQSHSGHCGASVCLLQAAFGKTKTQAWVNICEYIVQLKQIKSNFMITNRHKKQYTTVIYTHTPIIFLLQ